MPPDAPTSEAARGQEMTERPKPPTRIQARNRAAILEAALTVFSENGYQGATVAAIARAAGLSKPNLLYYFPSKAAIYEALLTTHLETWLAPLQALDPEGAPRDELLRYVGRKLEMSRQMPRESRLFAGEMLAGAPVMGGTLAGDLRRLVDEKARVIAAWSAAGRIAPIDPHHLIFAVWALTQHYADFEVQVRAVLGPGRDPFAEAETVLADLFARLLAPEGGAPAGPGAQPAGPVAQPIGPGAQPAAPSRPERTRS